MSDTETIPRPQLESTSFEERVLPDFIEYRPSGTKPDAPSVKIEAYSSSPEYSNPEATPIVALLGYGEGGEAARDAVNILSEMTGRPVIAPVLNYDHSKNEVDLEKSVAESVLATVEHINSSIGNDKHTPVDVIAKSQGGAVIANAMDKFSEDPETDNIVRALALISPAGLLNEKMGKRLLARKARFIGGLVIKNNMRADQFPYNLSFGRFKRDGEKGYRKNLKAAQSVSKLFASDLIGGRLNKKLNIAFGLNGEAIANSIKKRNESGKPTMVFAGNKDRLFHFKKYREVLSDAASEEALEVVPDGSHSAVMTPGGNVQLEDAAYWLMDIEDRSTPTR